MISASVRAELARHGDAHPEHFMRKFSTHSRLWSDIAELFIVRFGLHMGPRLRILDIGSGYGYFMSACRGHGHEVVGVDMPDPVIQEATRILDTEYTPHEVTEDNLLPDGLGTFDVATMMGVNLRTGDEFWQHQQYRKLWLTIADHLESGGAWIIQPNHGPNTDYLVDEAFWSDVLRDEGRAVIHTNPEGRRVFAEVAKG